MLASGPLSPSRGDSPSALGRSSEGAPSPAPSGPDTSGALSIFAPPVSSTLPEALQSVLGTSKTTASTPGPSTSNTNGNGNGTASTPTTNGSGRELRVRLNVAQETNGTDTPSLAKEAADGLSSTRLRPTRGRDSLQRTGVSASGKGVKVGGGVRVNNATPKTAVSSATRKQPKPTEPVSHPKPLHLCHRALLTAISNRIKTSVQRVAESANSSAVMDVPDHSTLCVWNRPYAWTSYQKRTTGTVANAGRKG